MNFDGGHRGVKVRLIVTVLFVLAGLAVWYFRHQLRPVALPPKPRTIEEVIAALGAPVERRLRPAFERAGIAFPPRDLTLLALKEEKRLELYTSGDDGNHHYLLSYPILATSGTAGPKLREGDKQVPEGFYRIELLNPNSRYHLSLRVDYPNAADIERARFDGRDLSVLGGDIMIHGGAESIGCLAIGDTAVEELFVMVARTGLGNVRLIIAPRDLRQKSMHATPEEGPLWTAELHDQLRRQIARLPAVQR
jgi:L,D-transpeptidase catalytic domain